MIKRYERYKDSGVDWIGEIPEHWEVKKLKYLAMIMPSNIDKKSKDDEKHVYLCNYLDVYRNALIDKNIDFMQATASDAQIEKFQLKIGDVIATKDSEDPADIGISAYVSESLENTVCGYHLTLMRPIKRGLLGNYLFQIFCTNQYRNYFETEANGITRYALCSDSFANLPTLLPPLTEQDAIAAFLDHKAAEINQLIANKEKLITLYEEEKTAMINQAVTRGLDPNVKLKPSGIEWLGDTPEHWALIKIRHLFKIIKHIAGEMGYDILSITQTGVKIKDISKNDGQISSDYTKYQKVEIGDFAMNHMDLLTGYIDISQFNGVTSPDYRVFKLTYKDADPDYYLNIFQMCYKEKIFYPLGQGAAQFGRWRLPSDEFLDFLLPVPPKSEQTLIVTNIETQCQRIDTIIEKLKNQIELFKEYRTILISEVVTGKIDVRGEAVL